jgi:hypothetical protein
MIILDRQLCRKMSEISYNQFKSIVDPKSLRSNEFHIDHRLSILDGISNWVDPKIIAHPANLCILTQKENLSKSGKSSISLDCLLKDINRFELRYGIFEPNCEYYPESVNWRKAA